MAQNWSNIAMDHYKEDATNIFFYKPHWNFYLNFTVSALLAFLESAYVVLF